MHNDLPFIEDEAQRETESDLESEVEFWSQAVVTASDWTSETILNQIAKGNILLNPSFQRRDAWTVDRKSKFVESIVLGLPIPQIVLAESREQRGKYLVLDGKQRLLSLAKFVGLYDFDIYKLKSLDIRADLNGKTYADLSQDPNFSEELSSFENQTIRTVLIKNWPNEKFLYTVFLRLNTSSVSLSPQELRQALHPGKFVTFVDEESSNSAALRNILNKHEPDFRMRDAELLVRYFAFKNFLSSYSGSLKPFLDSCCNELNENWEARQQELRYQLEQFEESHQFTLSIFGQHSYRKWKESGYENRFNRAVFDLLVLSFSEATVRSLLSDRKPDVEALFKRLCETDSLFLNSLEQTTKSLGATHSRISRWFNSLNEQFGVDLPEYQLIENRITT